MRVPIIRQSREVLQKGYKLNTTGKKEVQLDGSGAYTKKWVQKLNFEGLVGKGEKVIPAMRQHQ